MDDLAKKIIQESLNGQQPAQTPGPEAMATMTMPDGTTQIVPVAVAQVMLLQQINVSVVTLIAQGEALAQKITELESRIPGGFKFGRRRDANGEGNGT